MSGIDARFDLGWEIIGSIRVILLCRARHDDDVVDVGGSGSGSRDGWRGGSSLPSSWDRPCCSSNARAPHDARSRTLSYTSRDREDDDGMSGTLLLSRLCEYGRRRVSWCDDE